MFKKFKVMDEAFQYVRWFSLIVVVGALVFSGLVVYYSLQHAEKATQRIYLLSNGKVLEAVASDRKENLPVEARDQVRSFHRWFFDLDPDEKAIRAGMERAFYLADGSAKKLYDDQVERGFIGGLISGNISQRVLLDSIWLDLRVEPYAFRCTGTQTLRRSTSLSTRRIVTQGWLRSVERTDNKPHGFLIERFEVLENQNEQTKTIHP